MRLLKQVGAVGAVSLVGSLLVQAVQDNAWLTLSFGALTAVLALFTYAWVVRRTEHREPMEVVRTGAGGALGRGALIGFGLFSAVIVNIAFLGYYRVDKFGSVTAMLGMVGFMAAAAVTEELVFRGILFRIVEGRFGTWLALTLSALIFGGSHLFNDHATVWGALAIAVEAGGMLGAAYVATRTLWVPIGLHFAWNFAQGGIFGAEVSGNGESHGLLHSVHSGPSLLSGGDFGPEASVYSLLACVSAMAVFLWLARRRGQIVPRRRRTAPPPADARLAQ